MRIEDAAQTFSQTEEEYAGWVTYLTDRAQPHRTSLDEIMIESLGETIIKFLGLETGDKIQIFRDLLDSNRLMIVRHPRRKRNSESSRKQCEVLVE